MGCSSSKQQYIDEKIVVPFVTSGRISEAKSEDSGISLSAEETTEQDAKEKDSHGSTGTRNSAVDKSKPKLPRKGVAFDVPFSSSSIIKGYPPKRLLSRMTTANSKSNHNLVTSQTEAHERMREIVQRQVRAEQLREQERHSVVARQKRRDARAKKVQERRRKLQEETEETEETEAWGDEDDESEIDCDHNFNDDEDYDFGSRNESSELGEKQSVDLNKDEQNSEDDTDSKENATDSEL